MENVSLANDKIKSSWTRRRGEIHDHNMGMSCSRGELQYRWMFQGIKSTGQFDGTYQKGMLLLRLQQLHHSVEVEVSNEKMGNLQMFLISSVISCSRFVLISF